MRIERAAQVRFVGRGRELAVIDLAIQGVSGGQFRLVLVSGEAGVGKSRLVGEAVARLRKAGFTIVLGGCVNLRDDAAPLAPFAEALRGLMHEIGSDRMRELSGPARNALSGLLPGLVAASESGTDHGVMGTPPQDRLDGHLVDFFLRLSEIAPIALIIEDIHWADRATVDLLRLLNRNLKDLPALLLLTYRVDEQDPDGRLSAFLAEIQRASDPDRIAMQPFSRGELAEQAHAIFGGPVKRSTLEVIESRSEGNPFYAEQLLAANAPDSQLPTSLQELLKARLDALPPDERLVVGVLAVHASPATEMDVRAVTELGVGEFGIAVRALLDRKIVERRHFSGEERLCLRHALLQEVAYGDLLLTERHGLHGALARLLQARIATDAPDPFDLAELARHWAEAGEDAAAFSAAIRAGASAEAAYQHALAYEQYERALRLRQKLDHAAIDDDLDLLRSAARAAAALGSSRSVELIETALEKVDADANPVEAGLLFERLGRYKRYAADGSGALAAYERAVDLVPADPRSSARARVTGGLAQVLMIQARFDASMPWCEEAIGNARAVGDRGLEIHALNTMGVCAAYLGDPDAGLAMIEESGAVAAAFGSIEDVGRAVANRVDVLFVSGRFEQAAELGRREFPFLLQHGDFVNGVSGLVYSAWALQCLARWSEALATVAEARRYPSDVNDQVLGLTIAALAEACRGDLDLARSHIEMARPVMANAVDTQLLMPFALAEGETQLWEKRPDLAVDAVREAMYRGQSPIGANVSRSGPLYWLGLRAAADEMANHPDAEREARARELADACVAAMNELGANIAARSPAFADLTETFSALCAGEAARFEGRVDVAAWARAADRVAAFGLPYAPPMRNGVTLPQPLRRVADWPKRARHLQMLGVSRPTSKRGRCVLRSTA